MVMNSHPPLLQLFTPLKLFGPVEGFHQAKLPQTYMSFKLFTYQSKGMHSNKQCLPKSMLDSLQPQCTQTLSNK